MQNKTKIALSLGTITAIAAPMATISCNVSIGYKPIFWNYEDYMSQRGMDNVDRHFAYSQFGDLPEMEQSLNEGRTIGGVGSDYYNAKWASKGLLQKIDFSRAMHMDYTSKADLKAKLKKGYTSQAWKQMEMFNSYLSDHHTDVDNDGVDDELWEFMIPYFMQSKVLAFNYERGSESFKNKIIAAGDDQTKIDALFSDKSYLGLLKTLKNNGFTNFVVNDYARDNMMIGSELTKFSGKLDESNFKSNIDNFVKTIKDGMNIDIKDGSKVIFETSGTGSLDHLVNPKENWGSSFLYNGDALFAHYGGSIEKIEGKIRVVVPNNPVFLLDGLVLANNANEIDKAKFYDSVYNGFIKGWSDTMDKDYHKTGDYLDSSAAANNFDSVNYTTPFEDVYNNFKAGGPEDYFVSDATGENIFHVASESKMSEDTVISPISDKLQYQYTKYYLSKTS